MSYPIWPVVTENLAEQLSATQAGVIHPAQLLPYLPLSLDLAAQTLDALAESARVEKSTSKDGSTAYIFKESANESPRKFSPRQCVYSKELLDDHEYSVLSPEVGKQVKAELSLLASNDIWPAQAVWEHELLFLTENLPAPTSTSAIAGHSRLPFKKVEQRLNELLDRGVLSLDKELNAWETPPMRYPKRAYDRNDQYIRQFPGAIREELEVRLVRGLSISLIILLACLILAVVAKIPFIVLLFSGLITAILVFVKIIKAHPKALPEL